MMWTRKNLYDRLSMLITDYERGHVCFPDGTSEDWGDDVHVLMVDLQNHWEDITGDDPDTGGPTIGEIRQAQEAPTDHTITLDRDLFNDLLMEVVCEADMYELMSIGDGEVGRLWANHYRKDIADLAGVYIHEGEKARREA